MGVSFSAAARPRISICRRSPRCGRFTASRRAGTTISSRSRRTRWSGADCRERRLPKPSAGARSIRACCPTPSSPIATRRSRSRSSASTPWVRRMGAGDARSSCTNEISSSERSHGKRRRRRRSASRRPNNAKMQKCQNARTFERTESRGLPSCAVALLHCCIVAFLRFLVMGTLPSELAPHAERLSPRPRIYADANVPAGLVAYMRTRLQWDVLFVLEEEGLRRAPDLKHYRLAQQLRRTLVTMDRDYLDDRRFPPGEGSGVLVINAPDEHQLTLLLERIDRSLFCDDASIPLPLAGRKLQVNSDWGREAS